MISRRSVLAAGAGAIATSLSGCERLEQIPPPPPPPGIGNAPVQFPLQPSANRRHLVDAAGRPFFLQGDTPWSMPAQLVNAQIDRYFADRTARRFSAIMIMPAEHGNSSQKPVWNNADGVAPFTSMNPVNWQLNDAYWRRVDYIVEQAKSRGMACVMTPAWFGYRARGTGWHAEVVATPDAVLREYGAALATRYAQGNVIWSMGGDFAGTEADRRKQWNVIDGIRSVREGDLVTAHPERTEDTHAYWHGFAGFNLNAIYTQIRENNEYGEAMDAWRKPGPMPFFNIEALYENEGKFTLPEGRRQAYVSILSGACGFFFGNNPLWGFGDPRSCGGIGPEKALRKGLATPGARDMTTLGDFFRSFAWHLLEPRVDATLVTSDLGTGASRIAPALASDGSFAVIWSRGSSFSVQLSALTVPAIRARWFDPSRATYSDASASALRPAGQQQFKAEGDRILVLDAAG